MGFGTPPVEVPVLEGDYSDYSIYDTFKDTDSSNGYRKQDAVFNLDETIAILFDAENIILKTYTIASKTLSAAIKSDISYFDGDIGVIGLNRKTAYRSYNVVLGYTTSSVNCDKVYIFKNGVLIKTLEDSDLGITDNKIRAAAISPKGKYIIVSGYITAESEMGWVILEGS